MTRQYFSHAVLIASMLLASAGVASADIVQCVDDDGSITYTDTPCKNGGDVLVFENLAQPVVASTPVEAPAKNWAAVVDSRESAASKTRIYKRNLPLDVATLREARSSLALQDHAHYLSRQEKLASLN